MSSSNSQKSNFDAGEFVGGTFIKKEDLSAGPQRYTIEDVSKATFEARNGSPAEDVLQLRLDDNRTFSLNKTNLRILIEAYGRSTTDWIGESTRQGERNRDMQRNGSRAEAQGCRAARSPSGDAAHGPAGGSCTDR